MKTTYDLYYKSKQEIDKIRRKSKIFFDNHEEYSVFRDELYSHLSNIEELLDNEIFPDYGE